MKALKAILKPLLVVLYIPFFLILLVLVSVKFQLLVPKFWINSFEKYDTYQRIEDLVPNMIEASKEREGEDNIDPRFLTALITKENLKPFLEKNIEFILNFANGKSETWMVYMPIETLPKNLLPNFLTTSSEVPLETIISFVSRGNPKPIQIPYQVPMTGNFALLAVVVWSILLGLYCLLLRKLKVLSTSLIVSGVFTALLVLAINTARIAIQNLWLKEAHPSQLLLMTFAPQLINQIIFLWLIFSIVSILLGIILKVFTKKK